MPFNLPPASHNVYILLYWEQPRRNAIQFTSRFTQRLHPAVLRTATKECHSIYLPLHTTSASCCIENSHEGMPFNLPPASHNVCILLYWEQPRRNAIQFTSRFTQRLHPAVLRTATKECHSIYLLLHTTSTSRCIENSHEGMPFNLPPASHNVYILLYWEQPRRNAIQFTSRFTQRLHPAVLRTATKECHSIYLPLHTTSASCCFESRHEVKAIQFTSRFTQRLHPAALRADTKLRPFNLPLCFFYLLM